MRIACLIKKTATERHSEYVILIAFHSNIGYWNESQCYVYMYIFCLVKSHIIGTSWNKECFLIRQLHV